MRPELFRISLPDWSWLPVHELPVRGYGAMLALGFLAAILVAAWRARREGENPDHIYNIGILALLGGVVGARVFDVMEYSSRYPDWTRGLNLFDGLNPLWLVAGAAVGAMAVFAGLLPGRSPAGSKYRWVGPAVWAAILGLVAGRYGAIRETQQAALAAGLADPYAGFIDALKVTSGGLTVYGGLLLATAAVLPYLIYIRYRHGVNPLKMLDILAPSLALGLAFGRMGCFLNGCCYGAPCDLPWAIAWPDGSIPYNAYLDMGYKVVPHIHPTQLYSVANALLLFLVLHLAYRWKPRHGVLLGAAFGLKAISRFLIEMLRSDEAKIYMGGLSISQVVSIFIVVAVVIYFLWLRRSKMADLMWQPQVSAVAANKPKRK